MYSTVQDLHHQLIDVLCQQNEDQLRALLSDVNPADIAEVMELIEDVDRSRILFTLDSRAAAEVITLLDERVRDEVVDEIAGDRLAEMVGELPLDDAADFVGDLPEQAGDELLGKLPRSRSRQIKHLLKFGGETAGGLMNPEVVRIPQDCTVRESIDLLRKAAVDDEVFQIYTIDENRRLTGTVSPRRLLISHPERPLSDIMEPVTAQVTVEEDQEDVVNLFRKYDLTSLPVVDDHGMLVGHITVDDVMDVAADEADEDMYRMAGTDPSERATSSTFRAFRIRLVWLLPAFLLMAGSATVILVSARYFHAYDALVAFVPMIGAMAGCCSVQTSTVITRGLATGELAPSMLRFAFARESRIAVVMAPACGACALILVSVGLPLLRHIGAVSRTTDISGVPVAVGVGMVAAIILASMLGIVMPFLFRRMGIDPAIAAGPMVTSANDVLCVSLYFSLAYLMLE